MKHNFEILRQTAYAIRGFNVTKGKPCNALTHSSPE